jgi:hypothetical protein
MVEPLHVNNNALRKAIDAFAVDFALLLAGWVAYGQHEVEAYSTDQIVVAAASSIGAFAKTRSDYDPQMDITEAVQLTVHTYAEAMKANLVAQLTEIEAQAQADAATAGHLSEEELEDMRHMLDNDPSVLGTAKELAMQAVEHEEVDVERASGAVAAR